jgi:hypothetical protein
MGRKRGRGSHGMKPLEDYFMILNDSAYDCIARADGLDI